MTELIRANPPLSLRPNLRENLSSWCPVYLTLASNIAVAFGLISESEWLIWLALPISLTAAISASKKSYAGWKQMWFWAFLSVGAPLVLLVIASGFHFDLLSGFAMISGGMGSLSLVICGIPVLLHHDQALRPSLYGLPPLPVCEVCRYDLTGNVTGICPECGTPIYGIKPDSCDN